MLDSQMQLGKQIDKLGSNRNNLVPVCQLTICFSRLQTQHNKARRTLFGVPALINELLNSSLPNTSQVKKKIKTMDTPHHTNKTTKNPYHAIKDRTFYNQDTRTSQWEPEMGKGRRRLY